MSAGEVCSIGYKCADCELQITRAENEGAVVVLEHQASICLEKM
jgi:hypothetical protein